MFVFIWIWHLLRGIVLRAQSTAFGVWNIFVWSFTQIARMIILVANTMVFPKSKTGRPQPTAITVWVLLNAALYVAVVFAAAPDVEAYAGLGMAGLHFLIIVSALLVIAEENDVWGATYASIARAARSPPAIAGTTVPSNGAEFSSPCP